MILISHRGNISGPNLEMENKIPYINRAILLGFHCEIDVWFKNGTLFLGHDKPEEEIDWLWYSTNHDKLWVHCKDLESLTLCSKTITGRFFYHNNDSYTLTSKGEIWTYPNSKFNESCIIVNNNKKTENINCAGICSDYIETYK